MSKVIKVILKKNLMCVPSSCRMLCPSRGMLDLASSEEIIYLTKIDDPCYGCTKPHIYIDNILGCQWDYNWIERIIHEPIKTDYICLRHL